MESATADMIEAITFDLDTCRAAAGEAGARLLTDLGSLAEQPVGLAHYQSTDTV